MGGVGRGGEQLQSKGGEIVISSLPCSCVKRIHIQPSAGGTAACGPGAAVLLRGISLSLRIFLETNLMWSATCGLISSLYFSALLIQRKPGPLHCTVSWLGLNRACWL